LIIFGSFALASALGSLVVGFARKATNPWQNVAVPAAIQLLVGTLALTALSSGSAGQLASLQSLVIGYLVLNAAYSVYLASRSGFKTVEGREHSIAAGLAALIAIIYVATNPEPLNAAGFLGAYFALSAVHQAIWAASPTKAD